MKMYFRAEDVSVVECFPRMYENMSLIFRIHPQTYTLFCYTEVKTKVTHAALLKQQKYNVIIFIITLFSQVSNNLPDKSVYEDF